MILLIDGLGTSGKAVLRGLIEGHPDFFVTPNHDMIADCLCNIKDDSWLKYRDILELRTILSNDTYYYQLEWFNYRKYFDYDMSVKDRCQFPFCLDFYEFDKKWMSKLQKEPQWTPQIIATHIFESMLESWEDYPYNKNDIKYYVSMGFDRPYTAGNFVKYYPDGKMIYLVRSIDAIIATRANRKPVLDDMRSMCLLETTPEKLVKADHVKKLMQRQKEVEDEAKRYPDRIKIINFEDMIMNTEKVMREISEFLDVEYKETMLSCTVMGKEMITQSGEKYIGKILDDPEKLLNEFQKAIINMDISIKNYRHYKKNISAMLFIIILNLKRYWKKIRLRISSILLPEMKHKFTSAWQRDGFF